MATIGLRASIRNSDKRFHTDAMKACRSEIEINIIRSRNESRGNFWK